MSLHCFLEVFADEVDDDEIFRSATGEAKDSLKKDRK
jgi:hypothetical protein